MDMKSSESQVQYHRRRVVDMKAVRQPWESSWQGLADFIAPHRLRLQSIHERSISRRKIIDSTATFALRTLASGMHSGLTSPARPWFKLNTPDPDLRQWGPVKAWVDDVEKIMRDMFARSNVYTAFHQGYYDQGLFGQSYGLMVEDEKTDVRMIQILHGRCWIARDETGQTTTLYRQFRWSVDKIVRRFGYANCSDTIRTQYDRSNYDQSYDIWHAVEQRQSREPGKIDKKNKPFLSNYWEDIVTSGSGKLLEESGFDENPIIAPGWEICGDDNYAQSPAMDILGDVKSLQTKHRDKLEAIAKIVKPPLQGPTSLSGNPVFTLPGEITFVDDPTGKGLRPVMDVNLRIAELQNDIKEDQDRINRGMYADLFLMLANMEGIQPRNTMEISERKEEKLLALGPVLENIYSGQLEPVIERAFAIGMRRGKFPPPPQDIHGAPLSVEYISTLAQAQKAVATGSIERVAGFIGNLAGMRPDALDKLDVDQAIDTYADMVGAPAAMIVADDKVQAIRDQRAKQQQQAQAADMANKAAPAVSAGAQAAQVLANAANNPGGQALLNKLGILPS